MIDRKSNMKKKLTFLGIETSCDETAASVVREKTDGTGDILSNCELDFISKFFTWLE